MIKKVSGLEMNNDITKMLDEFTKIEAVEGIMLAGSRAVKTNDELSDYDYRLNIGPGLGYKLIEDEIQTVDIQGGLDYAYDKYKTGTKDNYLAGRTELNYKYKISINITLNLKW